MKTYAGVGCINSLFLDLRTSGRWMVSLTSRQLCTWGNSPRYPLDRGLGGPQSRSGRHGEVKSHAVTGTRTLTPWSSIHCLSSIFAIVVDIWKLDTSVVCQTCYQLCQFCRQARTFSHRHNLPRNDALAGSVQETKHKRPGKPSRGVLMLHDNARPHAAHATRDTLCRFGWGVLDHPRVTITCLGPWRRLWRAGGSWGNGTMVDPATLVLRGGYNESCAALGQVPKQRWSVPVACLVLPSACCHCGVVVGVKYILYTFLDPCPCFTSSAHIYFAISDNMADARNCVVVTTIAVLNLVRWNSLRQ
jgi:hypothetical protein